MSLLVHELLIGTGGGGSGPSNLQTTPSNPVSIASVTVTHSNSTVQVAHLPNRVVTITSSQSRPAVSDKGSRLANALAGNPPYSYASSPSQQRFAHLQPPNRHILTTAAITSTQSDSLKPSKAVSSRQTYILPFVLQDHNYGAPPPPTPPHSPLPSISPQSISPSRSSSFKTQQIFTTSKASNTSPNPKKPCDVSYTQLKKQNPKITSEPSVITVSDVAAVKVSSISCRDSLTTSHTPSIASQIMASMPLHQQQFMPHPKASLYPSSHIPPTTLICESLVTPTVSMPSVGGQDTDEESRLSDRSSSVGPSGEETETAPEGEGEDQVQADDSITRCICNFTHDDGYMIQCDRCFVWQHVDCMEIDRNNIPDEYLCEACKPRSTDKSKARSLQVRRRQEIRAHLARISSSDSEDNHSLPSRNKLSNKPQERKVLKKKKPKTSKENKSSRKLPPSSKSLSSIATPYHVKLVHSSDEREAKPPGLKSRRRQSTISGGSQNLVEESPTLTLEQLRSWIDVYEVAVTNHYSPELRAKVHAVRINGISAEFRESTQGALLGHRCRVAPSYDVGPDSFEDKILVAATRLTPGTAIIEYQGKYTLKSQWNSVQIPPNLPYLPFVLQYTMQKESLSVCVDARTYGNDARFARRSTQSNAEVLHVVERGSLHLYIVASKEIEEEEEIILPLQTAICQQNVPSIFPQTIKDKELGNGKSKEEPAKGVSSAPPQVCKNGIFNKKNVRKPLLTLALPQPLNRTSRRAPSSENQPCEELGNPTPAGSPTKQRRSSGCGGGSRSPAKCPLKSPSKSPLKAPPPLDDSSSGDSPHQDSPGNDHKMTREERKIAAYMKAFERMEKAAQRRQEIEKKKVEDKGKKEVSPEEEEGNRTGSADESAKVFPMDKEDKKGKMPKVDLQKCDYFEDDNNGSSSEGERKLFEGPLLGYSSPPSSGTHSAGFRFPKTKKALMNEWLNETIDPVLHSTPSGSEVTTGVPTCYMRSPSTPLRKSSGPSSSSPAVVEMAGRSAKKRWLRQAIIDETDPQTSTGFSICSSPNSRPDSPTSAGDYITPLKKRRLARESMSSEQSNTPPSTPLHPGFEEKYNEEIELEHTQEETLDSEEVKGSIKLEKDFKDNLKIEINLKKEEAYETDYKANFSDRLTINISQISSEIKSEPCESKIEVGSKLNYPLIVSDKESDSSKQDADSRNDRKPIALVSEDSLQRKVKFEKNSRPFVKLREDEKGKKLMHEESSKLTNNSCRKLKKNVHSERKKCDKMKNKKKKLDKNRNMELMKNHTEKPKSKKLKSLKDRSHHVTKSAIHVSEGSENFNCVDKPVEEADTEKLPIPNNSREISLDSQECSSDEKKGPQTPDATPPQSIIKDYSSPRLLEKVSFLTDQLSETKSNASLIIKDEQVTYPKEDSLVGKLGSISAEEEPLLTDENKEQQPLTPEVHGIHTKPAAIKRKLSILEYRKRRSITCEGDLKEDLSQKTISRSIPPDVPSGFEEASIPRVISSQWDCVTPKKSSDSVTSLPTCLADLAPHPLPPLAPLLNTDKMKVKKLKCEGSMLHPSTDGSQEVKWNAAPTLVEQQRENLTARLRREFGLYLSEDNVNKLKLGDKSMKEKWPEGDKRQSFPMKRPSPTVVATSSLYMPPMQKPSTNLKPIPKSGSLIHPSHTAVVTYLGSSGYNHEQVLPNVTLPHSEGEGKVGVSELSVPFPKMKLPPSICTSSDFRGPIPFQCDATGANDGEEGGNTPMS